MPNEQSNAKPQPKNPRLTPDELVVLAERVVASTDPHKIAKLKKEMERGFYGDPQAA